MVDPADVLELDEQGEPGTTTFLTEEGWQAVPYEEPGEGWRMLPDGSWESPDGHTRTFPLDNATGD
jgi:hypothetical protein